MAPVIRELRGVGGFDVKVCVTAQHRQMLDQILTFFEITPDFDLNLMAPNQQLGDLAARVLQGMRRVYKQFRPDIVLVQGDTVTTFAASLSAFYEKIAVGHVEAGLRTRNPHSPWPEEINRCLTTVVSTHHFAPTESARRNLLSEGIDAESIAVTGNTVIDALKHVLARLAHDRQLSRRYEQQFAHIDGGRRLVLVTGHRRENFGDGFRRICTALRELAKREDIELVYPVHLNPNVRGPVQQMLSKVRNIHLLEPMDYEPFSYLLNRCYMVITDSGGIQEEATYLGKPVLLMRDTTERPEALEAGTVKLVGTDPATILSEAHCLLDDDRAYSAMARASNHFGDGFASGRIVNYLKAIKGVQVAHVS